MLPQNLSTNAFACVSATQLTSALFDLGDCFGNLCRLPLRTALKLFSFASAEDDSENCTLQTAGRSPHFLAQQLKTNIPFAVSCEWNNQVWRYQISCHQQDSAHANQTLHRHLSSRSLSCIPTEQKRHLQEWLYFASPLNKLTQLDWQLLSEQEQRLQRLQSLAYWFQQKLEQGSLIEDLLLVPLTDLPLGDGLTVRPSYSFARLGKLALPGPQKLSALKFAIIRQGALTEGYGLQPTKLFAICDQLSAQISTDEHQPLLLLDHSQCLDSLDRLERVLNRPKIA